jgi:large subunit ribosomal protein L4
MPSKQVKIQKGFTTPRTKGKIASQKSKVEEPISKTVKTSITSSKIAASDKNSISATVYDMTGKASGRINLPYEIFGAKVNPALMAQAVRVYLTSQRTGTASVKTRSNVSGTTKKMYRQKGTGRARHGAAKAPIFVGGGVAHGPKVKEFNLSLPKKMKKAALFSALTSFLNDKKIVVLDAQKATGKTRDMANALGKLDILGKKVMFVINKDSNMAGRSAKNIKGTKVIRAENLNTYEVLNNNAVVVLRESIDTIKNTFLREGSS